MHAVSYYDSAVVILSLIVCCFARATCFVLLVLFLSWLLSFFLLASFLAAIIMLAARLLACVSALLSSLDVDLGRN